MYPFDLNLIFFSQSGLGIYAHTVHGKLQYCGIDESGFRHSAVWSFKCFWVEIVLALAS